MNMSWLEALGWAVYLGGVGVFTWQFLAMKKKWPEDFTQDTVTYVGWSLGWPVVLTVELLLHVPAFRRWRERKAGKMVSMNQILAECGIDPVDWDTVLFPRLVALGEDRFDALFRGRLVNVSVEEWNRLTGQQEDACS